jgi:flagellar export protein FliJ
MAFRYRLQPILRLHRSLEHQEEQRLLALASVVNQLRSELETRQRSDLAVRRAALAEMELFSSGAQLQFRAWCEDLARKRLELLRAQLSEAERRRLEQLKVYQEARQRREIFEGLRHKQEDIYHRELLRGEQQAADEAFLMRSLGAQPD